MPARHRQLQDGLQQAVDVRRAEQILTARHQIHALHRIVERHREMIARRHLLAGENDIAMGERLRQIDAGWRKRGYDLGVGIGIARGYATIGAIGFEGRWDYGAIGTVTNLAARLCAEARPTEILVSQRVAGAVEELVTLEPLPPLALKGFSRPVPAFRVLGPKGSPA